MKTSNSRIESLTSLRFFMCVIVVIAHMEFLGGADSPNFFNYYLQNAAVAVDFFFVLSGFGLTLSFNRKPSGLIENYSLGKAVGYATGRVNKLYKVYLVTMLCAIPADFLEKVFRGQSVLAATAKTGVNILIAPTLLQSASGLLAVSHALNGVAWFLSCLFILYMIYPLLERLNAKIRVKDMVGATMAITLGVASVVHRFFVSLEVNYSPFGFTLDLSHGSPYMRVFHLFLGMLLADFVIKKGDVITGIKATICEGVAILFAIIATLFGNRILNGELVEIKNLVYLISAMLVVYTFAICRGQVSTMLETPIFVKLGNAAMYIFLIHYVVRQTLGIILYEFLEPSVLLNTIVVVLILFITGAGTWFCVKQNNNKKD